MLLQVTIGQVARIAIILLDEIRPENNRYRVGISHILLLTVVFHFLNTMI
jgi:hypothetical protein